MTCPAGSLTAEAATDKLLSQQQDVHGLLIQQQDGLCGLENSRCGDGLEINGDNRLVDSI
jgi:hypothetical protein